MCTSILFFASSSLDYITIARITGHLALMMFLDTRCNCYFPRGAVALNSSLLETGTTVHKFQLAFGCQQCLRLMLKHGALMKLSTLLNVGKYYTSNGQYCFLLKIALSGNHCFSLGKILSPAHCYFVVYFNGFSIQQMMFFIYFVSCVILLAVISRFTELHI